MRAVAAACDGAEPLHRLHRSAAATLTPTLRLLIRADRRVTLFQSKSVKRESASIMTGAHPTMPINLPGAGRPHEPIRLETRA